MWNHPTRVWAKALWWTASLLLTVLLTWCAEVQAAAPDRANEIDKLMSTLFERGQFNGAVLTVFHSNSLTPGLSENRTSAVR
jgi:hypothetical protein